LLARVEADFSSPIGLGNRPPSHCRSKKTSRGL
jgi:hypothetical protein